MTTPWRSGAISLMPIEGHIYMSSLHDSAECLQAERHSTDWR